MEYISNPDLPMNFDLIDPPEEPWEDPKHEIKTTKCRCSPEQKAKSRALLDSRQKPLIALSKMGVKADRALLNHSNSSGQGPQLEKIVPLREWNPLKRWLSLSKKTWSAQRASTSIVISPDTNPLDERRLPGGSYSIASTRINTLPPEILHPILDIVYADEDRSRGLCRCSRPKTAYWEVRKVSLEHHVVNTALLRTVCRAFHGWALENVFKGELEVDFSDFESLRRKFRSFGTNGTGVVRRLDEDFPRLRENGVVICLGNPGCISNIKAVVEAMKRARLDMFCGVTLWNLDYYHRECVPSLSELVYSKIPNLGTLPTIEIYPSMVDVMAGVTREIYHRDRLLFVELLICLVRNSLPLSTMHVPAASILDDILSTIPNRDYRNLAALTRGCKSIVIREFLRYNDTHVDEIRQSIHTSTTLKLALGDPLISEFGLNLHAFERLMRAEMIRGNVGNGSYHVAGPLDAHNIEFRRFTYAGRSMISTMSVENAFRLQEKMFKDLESLVIEGVDVAVISAGTLLNALLPFRGTLSTLIYKFPERARWPNPISSPDPLSYQDPMDPHHVCLLLRQFSKLKKVDLSSRFCHQLFEEHDECSEVATQRNWDFRLPVGWSRCSYDGQGNTSLRTAEPWTKALLEDFLISCRAWRDGHEASTNRRTSWKIKIHVRQWESWAELGGHEHRIVFMPLESPPCALLEDCDEGLHEEGFYEEKEGWMVMHMLNGRGLF
jgi:hypothetical protein